MRIVLQKVREASVHVENREIAAISQGYLLYVGVIAGDTEEQTTALAAKIVALRLFEGEDGPPGPDGSIRAGKINDRSIVDVEGEILIISQFTLAGKTEKGNRPDYTAAEKPDQAHKLYEFLIEEVRRCGVRTVEKGEFGAHMLIHSINDGPVTLVFDR